MPLKLPPRLALFSVGARGDVERPRLLCFLNLAVHAFPFLAQQRFRILIGRLPICKYPVSIFGMVEDDNAANLATRVHIHDAPGFAASVPRYVARGVRYDNVHICLSMLALALCRWQKNNASAILGVDDAVSVW